MAPRRIWLLATLLALASARSEGGSEGGDPGASNPNAEVSEDQNWRNQAGSESDSAPSVCLAWGQSIFVVQASASAVNGQTGSTQNERLTNYVIYDLGTIDGRKITSTSDLVSGDTLEITSARRQLASDDVRAGDSCVWMCSPAQAEGTKCETDSGAWVCDAPCGVHPNDIQCGDCADDRALPLLNFKTTYTEHKKKVVTGGDLVVDIPIELLDGCGIYNTSKPRDGICGASAATLFKTSIDEAWLELRHPMLGGLPAYDCVTDGACNYPNGGRENMTNMKDVAAAACSANTDCVGFQWLKEVSVTFKTSKTMSSSTKFNNFYEKITTSSID